MAVKSMYSRPILLRTTALLYYCCNSACIQHTIRSFRNSARRSFLYYYCSWLERLHRLPKCIKSQALAFKNTYDQNESSSKQDMRSPHNTASTRECLLTLVLIKLPLAHVFVGSSSSSHYMLLLLVICSVSAAYPRHIGRIPPPFC